MLLSQLKGGGHIKCTGVRVTVSLQHQPLEGCPAVGPKGHKGAPFCSEQMDTSKAGLAFHRTPE